MKKPKPETEKEKEKKRERDAIEQRPHFTKKIITKGDQSGTSNIDR